MQNDSAEGAISIKAFCERNHIGMTSAYAEIKAGRLIARKCGTRTLIAKADERAWLNGRGESVLVEDPVAARAAREYYERKYSR